MAKSIVVTDASTTGGAVGQAIRLGEDGTDFLVTNRKVARGPGSTTLPIFVLLLFNGIGGAFRAYDIAGI